MNYNKISSNGNKETNYTFELNVVPPITSDNSDTVVTESTISLPKEPIEYTVVNCGKLNVREKPTTDSDILGVLVNGNTILVEDITDDWAHVYTECGVEGYTMAEFIKGV